MISVQSIDGANPLIKPRAKGEAPDQIIDGREFLKPHKRAAAPVIPVLIETKVAPFYKKHKKRVSAVEKIYDLATNDFAMQVPDSVDMVVRGGLVVWGAGEIVTAVYKPEPSFLEIVLTSLKSLFNSLLFLDSAGVQTVNPLALKSAAVVCSVLLDVTTKDKTTGESKQRTVRVEMDERSLSSIPKPDLLRARNDARAVARDSLTEGPVPGAVAPRKVPSQPLLGTAALAGRFGKIADQFGSPNQEVPSAAGTSGLKFRSPMLTGLDGMAKASKPSLAIPTGPVRNLLTGDAYVPIVTMLLANTGPASEVADTLALKHAGSAVPDNEDSKETESQT